MWVHATVHSHLIYHILNSHLAHVKGGEGGEWCLKGPPGVTHLESKQLLTIGGDLHIHGLCACQSPTAPQRSFEPILSCKPETGTGWASNKASKTGSKDSLCSHLRGTNLLADKALRRLAPAKATGEIRPCCALVISFHMEVEPT